MDEEATEVEEGDPSSSSSSHVSPSAQQLSEWIRKQDLLKQRLITQDDFPWKPPSHEEVGGGEDDLVYVGGLDISFCTKDPSLGCATLVVLDFLTLRVVLEESAVVHLEVPYVPGFLAFREVTGDSSFDSEFLPTTDLCRAFGLVARIDRSIRDGKSVAYVMVNGLMVLFLLELALPCAGEADDIIAAVLNDLRDETLPIFTLRTDF